MTEQTKQTLLAIENAKKEYNEKIGRQYPIEKGLPNYVIVNTASSDFDHAMNETVNGVNNLLTQGFVPIGGVQMILLCGGTSVVVSQSMVRRPEVAK